MMRSVGLVFIYCLSLFLLPGCGQKKANKQDKQEYSQAVNYKMDSINTRIRCFFVTNPDSSEILLLLALNELDTLDYPERKFYVLLGLAEFYQNYKPNYMRAIDFITQAIEMYLKHPQKILLNTYAFIDIGNLFYNLHYYPQAISFYRIATEIENENKKSHSRILSLKNTGLAFQGLGAFDSAMYYFKMVDHLISNDKDILSAQNFNYIADLLLQKGISDSVKICAEKAKTILNQYYYQQQNDNEWLKTPVYRDWEFVRAEVHAILSDYYYKIGEYKDSEENFRQGMEHAELSKSMVPAIRLIENHALHDKLFPDYDSLIANAGMAMKYLLISKNLVNKQLFADSLSSMFLRLCLNGPAHRYAVISRQFNDSLMVLKASPERIQGMFKIASLATEQSKQILNQQVLDNLRKIHRQNNIILVVVTLFFLVSIALIIILMQYRRIKLAHLVLVTRIQDNLRLKEHREIYKGMPGNTEHRLDEQLTHVMLTQKPYLQKDITLQEMANILGSNKSYLSAYLNHHKNISFNDLLNRYRVEEICRLLSRTENDPFTFEYLAEQCGFRSRSTFYMAFKKFAGMSPATYRNHLRKTGR